MLVCQEGSARAREREVEKERLVRRGLGGHGIGTDIRIEKNADCKE
jgi:hypothetical protein